MAGNPPVADYDRGVTAQHLPADVPFFAQWAQRGSKPRTLDSAIALMTLLDFSPPPSLAVVGSKGKGTAAAAASTALSASGLTTVAVTSPAFRSNRERIRLDGRAISDADYRLISSRLSEVLGSLPSEHYLSPSGAFTIMGAWWASMIGADVLVLEEGMGGRTDEVSLFSHRAMAVTPIFEEHIGIIGDDLRSVAGNLLGAGSDRIEFVGTARQSPVVNALIEQNVSDWGADVVPSSPIAHTNPLIGENLGLGHAIGAALSEALGREAQPLPSLHLPGRTSIHHGPRGTWCVDAAISPAGVRAALAAAPLTNPTIVASWPLSKDVAACREIVPGAIHVSVPGLPYPDLPRFAEVVEGLEGDVLALGTISFIAEVLEYLKVPTDLW